MAAATTKWQRSSFCADRACVEVARIGDTVALRSSRDTDREPIVFSSQEWAGFVAWLALEHA